MDSKLTAWLESISSEGVLPNDCKAIYIGIFEQESEYGLHFLGSVEFDAEDDDWACEKADDYVPRHRYLLDTGMPTSTDWQTTLSQIADAVRRVSSAGTTILSAVDHIAVGFDDGGLEHI